EAGEPAYTLALYLTAPLLVVLTIAHLYALNQVMAGPSDVSQIVQIAGGTFLVGYLYALVGVTVAHELTHWSDSEFARQSARFLLSFTLNSTFTIYHVHGHHRLVAQYDDAATARRGESVFAFLVRTTVRQTLEAFLHEARRLQRSGQSAWSWRNRALSGQLY